MVCSILRWKRCNLRSRMSVCFVFLLAFTLLMILTQNTIWKIISQLSLKQCVAGSRIFQQCSEFTSEESRIKWDYLYYYQDLSKKKSLIWCKVPKAGSTSLARMFLRLAGATEAENFRAMHDKLRKFYPKLSPEVMTRRLNTTFKFLVVRHPFERILSGYRDKLENYSSRDPPYRIYGSRMVERPVEDGTAVYPTFPEFVTYLLETSPETYDEHWMPISRLCAPCSIHYDAIVKMENLNTEVKVPLRQAGIDENIGWERSAGTNRNTTEKYFQQLSFTQIQKLYDIYRKDFRLFGYTPDKYFTMALRETAKENFTLATTS